MIKGFGINYLIVFVFLLLNCLIINAIKKVIKNQCILQIIFVVCLVANIVLIIMLPSCFNLNNFIMHIFISVLYLLLIYICALYEIDKGCKILLFISKILLLSIPLLFSFYSELLYWNCIIIKMDTNDIVCINILLYIVLLILASLQIIMINVVINKLIICKTDFYFNVRNVNEIMILLFFVSLLYIISQKDIISQTYKDLLGDNKFIAYTQIHYYKLLVLANICIVLYSERNNIKKFFLNK